MIQSIEFKIKIVLQIWFERIWVFIFRLSFPVSVAESNNFIPAQVLMRKGCLQCWKMPSIKSAVVSLVSIHIYIIYRRPVGGILI